MFQEFVRRLTNRNFPSDARRLLPSVPRKHPTEVRGRSLKCQSLIILRQPTNKEVLLQFQENYHSTIRCEQVVIIFLNTHTQHFIPRKAIPAYPIHLYMRALEFMVKNDTF